MDALKSYLNEIQPARLEVLLQQMKRCCKNHFVIHDERKYEVARESRKALYFFYNFFYLLKSTEINMKHIYKQKNNLLCIPEAKC